MSKLIKSKVALISSAVLLGICMYLYFPFPNNQLVDARQRFMSFPIHNQDGYIPLGITGSVLFMIAMVLVVIGLKKYHVRAVIVAAISYVILPQIFITAYQETFARGIYAVSYNGQGTCNFDDVGNGYIKGICELVLHNHSNESISFELQFVDSDDLVDGHRMESLMNVAGPRIMTIEANEKKFIHLDELIDVSNVQKHISDGISHSVHIKIIEAGVERIL